MGNANRFSYDMLCFHFLTVHLKTVFKAKFKKVGLSSDPSIRKREKLKYINRAEHDKRS